MSIFDRIRSRLGTKKQSSGEVVFRNTSSISWDQDLKELHVYKKGEGDEYKNSPVSPVERLEFRDDVEISPYSNMDTSTVHLSFIKTVAVRYDGFRTANIIFYERVGE